MRLQKLNADAIETLASQLIDCAKKTGEGLKFVYHESADGVVDCTLEITRKQNAADQTADS